MIGQWPKCKGYPLCVLADFELNSAISKNATKQAKCDHTPTSTLFSVSSRPEGLATPRSSTRRSWRRAESGRIKTISRVPRENTPSISVQICWRGVVSHDIPLMDGLECVIKRCCANQVYISISFFDESFCDLNYQNIGNSGISRFLNFFSEKYFQDGFFVTSKSIVLD